jgi:Holliday junction resolvasome RuvABC endonuclease subunit
MRRVLGLDVSSSAIGIAVMDYDDTTATLVYSSYYNPLSNEENIFKRLEAVQVKINSILNEFKPDDVCIEEISQYMGGRSTANTIITLAVFNRTVGMVAYNYLGKPPEMFSVMKIRHGLKESKELPPKEDIPDLVAKKLGINFPWIMSMPKGKRISKKIVENYDVADSIAVALYYATVATRPPPPKVKKQKKVKE